MTENFPNLKKEAQNIQVQEAQSFPPNINLNKSIRHVVIKMTKVR